MNLKFEDLKNCFEKAKRLKYKYVAVKIDTLGYDNAEISICYHDDFDKKLKYYRYLYDDNLILKNNRDIRIIDFTSADTYEDIEEDLTLD